MGEWWNGRHEGLKIPWLQGCVGSSPISPTNKLIENITFFIFCIFIIEIDIAGWSSGSSLGSYTFKRE